MGNPGSTVLRIGPGGVRRFVTVPAEEAVIGVDPRDLAEAEALAAKYAAENKRLRKALIKKAGRKGEPRFCVCGCWLLPREPCPNCAAKLGVNPYEWVA